MSQITAHILVLFASGPTSYIHYTFATIHTPLSIKLHSLGETRQLPLGANSICIIVGPGIVQLTKKTHERRSLLAARDASYRLRH